MSAVKPYSQNCSVTIILEVKGIWSAEIKKRGKKEYIVKEALLL